MDTEHRIKEIFKSLGWDYSRAELDTQAMGATNASFRCRYLNDEYVVRLGSACSGLLTINRDAEKAALSAVSESGCGAPLICYDTASGNMVTRYIPSREVNGSDFSDDELFKRTVCLIKKLHSQRIDYRLDMYRDVEDRLNTIREKNIPLHPRFEEAYQKYRKVADRFPLENSEHWGLCHGDLFSCNILLGEDGQVLIIDYEYAGMSDIFYDLVCFSMGWDESGKRKLLELYFGECNPGLLEKLNLFNIISWMWNGTWAYLKSCEIPKEEFDYVDFGDRHIEAILNYTP